MTNICTHLKSKGLEMIDLTKPGQTPTDANIQALANSIRNLPTDLNQPVIPWNFLVI